MIDFRRRHVTQSCRKIYSLLARIKGKHRLGACVRLCRQIGTGAHEGYEWYKCTSVVESYAGGSSRKSERDGFGAINHAK